MSRRNFGRGCALYNCENRDEFIFLDGLRGVHLLDCVYRGNPQAMISFARLLCLTWFGPKLSRPPQNFNANYFVAIEGSGAGQNYGYVW
jgi:hypothetical protein